MNSLEVMEIGRQALIVFFKISLPILFTSMLVGLIISLFQALTQIQEMTLTFVPKIVIIFLALIFLMPFMVSTMMDFNDELYRRIVDVGKGGGDE
jgi:flagellar biosynthetic protein FliQ